MAIVSFSNEQIETICNKPTMQQMFDEFLAVRNQMLYGTRTPSEEQYPEEQRHVETSLFWTSVMLMVGYLKRASSPSGGLMMIHEAMVGKPPEEAGKIMSEHLLDKLVEIESQIGDYYSGTMRRVIEHAARADCQCEKCTTIRQLYHQQNAAELERMNAITNPDPADMPPI